MLCDGLPCTSCYNICHLKAPMFEFAFVLGFSFSPRVTRVLHSTFLCHPGVSLLLIAPFSLHAFVKKIEFFWRDGSVVKNIGSSCRGTWQLTTVLSPVPGDSMLSSDSSRTGHTQGAQIHVCIKTLTRIK